MKTKKIPLRTCVLTNEKLPKKDLLRIVRSSTGSVVVDETGKLNGRGAYIKKDIDAINKDKLNKKLASYLECSIPDDLYDNIIETIKNSN